VKLSVVLITYNHERFIAQALSSVLAQRTNFDFEIIVAEDCSTDGTRAIVTDFARRYPGKILPLLRERNLGMIPNLKEALAACRGSYVALLEGDDYWIRDDKLQSQVDFLDAHPDHAVCCTRAQFRDELNHREPYIWPPKASGSYPLLDLLETYCWIRTCTVMYRWGSVGSLPDWILTLKMADYPLSVLVARSGKIRLMDEVMSVYRVHQGGVWSSLSPEAQLLAHKQMYMALKKHLDPQYTNVIRQAVARHCLDLAITTRRNGSRWKTATHVFNYLRNGWELPGQRRLVGGLATYALIGRWYKLFSRAGKEVRLDSQRVP
jgi:glycosyltransferase involved in cell wall biosynthesis